MDTASFFQHVAEFEFYMFAGAFAIVVGALSLKAALFIVDTGLKHTFPAQLMRIKEVLLQPIFGGRRSRGGAQARVSLVSAVASTSLQGTVGADKRQTVVMGFGVGLSRRKSED